MAVGYLDCAGVWGFGHCRVLAGRSAPLDSLAAAAGTGPGLEATAPVLPLADGRSRHIALALAAQHGHADVVRSPLDAGEDPSFADPAGVSFSFDAPASSGTVPLCTVVRLLVERGCGALVDIRDTVYHGTPLDWAIHGGHTAIAEYLRDCGASKL